VSAREEDLLVLEVNVGDFHAVFAPDVPEVVVGRSSTAQVHVDDPRVSRVQAVLRFRDGAWLLEDHQSANGTFVQGRRVGVLEIVRPLVVRLADPDDGVSLFLAPGGREGVENTLVPRRDDVELIRIGRAGDNDVVLDDTLVSRYHAELRRDSSGRWELRDAGSANGIFVAGSRVDHVTIDDPVRVELGEHTLHVAPDARGGVRVDVVAHGHTMRIPAASKVEPVAPVAVADDDAKVTPRERELLALVAGGATDQQIADELFISIRTVRSHLDRIQEKTGMRRRADLTRLALGLGIAARRPGEA
jgi:pSer/pThr/pTyr-binding forkhead associated (FHA) protein/DNA-binding CsgD family transcriptional regulator